MSYRTFRAATAIEAKSEMRRALGMDAVVLSTRRHPDGSVELRAIAKGQPLFRGEGGVRGEGGGSFLFDRAREDQARPAAPTIGGLQGEEAGPSYAHPDVSTPRPGHDGADPPGTGAMGALRGSISEKLTRDARHADPLFREYQKSLGRHGITDRFVAALAEAGGGAPYDRDPARLAHALGRTLRFAPIVPQGGRPIMLVGQTGAGKTSSAAKLGARAAREGGRLSFLSADIGRAGAVEQLTTYAEALDTRFWPVNRPQDVADILRRERPQEALLLDTPGISPFARADVAAMRAFREVLGAEPVLVIPASGDVGEHTDWVQAFADLGVRRCIVTKFDTSRRVGAALSAAFKSDMALAQFSEAPFIADGLVDANPDYLASRLLLDAPGRLGGGR